MATTYYATSTALAVAAFSAANEQGLRQIIPAASTTLAGSIGASTSNVITHVFTGPANEPNLATWPTGGSNNYTLQYNITSATSITYDLLFGRILSDLSAQSGLWAGSAGNTGVGLKSFTTTTNVPASGNASDRIVVGLRGSNSDMMAAQNLTATVNTTDSYLSTPWTITAAIGDAKFPSGTARLGPFKS